MKFSLTSWVERYGSWMLLVLGLLLLLPGTTELPLLDRDEPRFSQATAEMMTRGEWVVPYFNGNYRFDKPPLTYWWMRLHYHLIGKTELGARLHSILACLMVALGIFHLGRKHLDPFASWLAAFGWLSCFQVFQHGRLALADMPMVAAVFFASWALFELTLPEKQEDKREGRWLWFWVAYLSLGLGFLAKGPIALLCPILSLALYRWVFWRKPLCWRYLRPARGSLLVLGLIAAWGIPALLATDGLFWKIGMGKHVIDRGMEAFNERKVIPFYYFITTLVSLFPWVALFGQRFSRIRSDWSPVTAFLLAWVAGPYLIFLAYSTQLPHYVLPAFPALLLWTFQIFKTPSSNWSRFGKIWFWVMVGLWELLVVALLVWVLVGEVNLPAAEIGAALIALILMLACMNALVVLVRYQAWVLALPFILAISIAQWRFGHEMRKLSPVISIAETLELLPPGVRLVGVGFEEPSLVFYTDRIWDFKVGAAGLEEDIRSPQGKHTCYLILRHEQIIDQMIQEGWGGPKPDLRRQLDIDLHALAADTHVIKPLQGMNFGRMRWSDLVILFPMDPLPSS
jgi:4-amino-4-deoxy-L-arabinose transferase-like glycosyltransferase